MKLGRWNRQTARNAWTSRDVMRLRVMCEAKLPFDRIARDLHRTLAACEQKAKALGFIVRRQKKERSFVSGNGTRPCMCCKQLFRSDGSHHRLCNNCRHHSVSPFEA